MRQGSWEYIFFVDLDGHAAEAPLDAVLEKLEACTSLLKILGSYPRAQATADDAQRRLAATLELTKF